MRCPRPGSMQALYAFSPGQMTDTSACRHQSGTYPLQLPKAVLLKSSAVLLPTAFQLRCLGLALQAWWPQVDLRKAACQVTFALVYRCSSQAAHFM